MLNRLLLLASAAVLVGCGSPAGTVPLVGPTVERVTATLVLEVRDASQRRLFADLAPWEKTDVNHVKLALHREGAISPTYTVTVPNADLGKAVVFINLLRATSYTVLARAWSDAAEAAQIDNLAFDAATCTSTFTTSNEPLAAAGTLRLQLRERGAVEPAR